MFTSFLFDSSFGVVDLEQNTVHALGSWNNAVAVTTPEDIGRLTAKILCSEPEIANRVVYTAGDTLTYEHLADILDEALQRSMQRVTCSLPKLKADLAQDPDNSIKKYRVVFAEGRGVAWHKEIAFARHRISVMETEQWVQENLLNR